MSLKDSIQSDAVDVFMNTDDFAESITYLPNGGSSRALTAIVDREPPSFYDAAGNLVTPRYALDVPNDATDGIAADEVNTGGDTITLAEDFNGSETVTCSVLVLLYQDEGMIRLAVR